MTELSFGYPSVLYSIPLLVTMLLWLAFRWRQRKAILEILRVKRQQIWQQQLQFVGLGVIVLGLAMALALPRLGFEEIRSADRPKDIVIVLDFSSSMWAQDVYPSRLEAAKRAVLDLQNVAEGSRFALVGFAGSAHPLMPLSRDKDQLRRVLQETSPENFRSQGTNVAAGIKKALDMFSSSGDLSIVVVSDGENNMNILDDVLNVSKQRGVSIYSVCLGGQSGVPIPLPMGGFLQNKQSEVVLTKRETHFLKRLSESSGGAMLESTNAQFSIETIYEKGVLRSMGGESEVLFSTRNWNELFQICLLLCVGGVVLRYWLFPRNGTAYVTAMLLLLCWRPLSASQFWSKSVDEIEVEGIELIRAGEMNRAERLLLEGILLAEQSEQKNRLQYNAGIAAYHSGNLRKAIRYWEQVLETDPKHHSAKNNIQLVAREIEERKRLTVERGKQEADVDETDQTTTVSSTNQNRINEEDRSIQEEEWIDTKHKASQLLLTVSEMNSRQEYRGIQDGEYGW